MRFILVVVRRESKINFANLCSVSVSAGQEESNERNPETIELSIVCGGLLKKIAKWVNIKVISAQLQLQKYPNCLIRIFYPVIFVVRK